MGDVRAEIAWRRTISVKDSICCEYRSKMIKGWNRGVYLNSYAISARTSHFTRTNPKRLWASHTLRQPKIDDSKTGWNPIFLDDSIKGRDSSQGCNNRKGQKSACGPFFPWFLIEAEVIVFTRYPKSKTASGLRQVSPGPWLTPRVVWASVTR